LEDKGQEERASEADISKRRIKHLEDSKQSLPKSYAGFAEVQEGTSLRQKIFQAQEMVKYAHNTEALERVARIVEELIPQLIEGVEQYREEARFQTLVIGPLIGQLVERDERFLYLLRQRAELYGYLGYWDEALADLQVLVNASEVVNPSDIRQAGILLMTLGEWTQARQLLHQAQKKARDDTDRILARGYELWIDDYRGHHWFVTKQSQKLLLNAWDVAPSAAGGIEHRKGRATFAAALAFHNRELMAIALEQLKTAQRTTIQTRGFANPYHEFWIYHASDALQTKDRDTCWEEAKQSVEAFGGPMIAHLRLAEAGRAIQRGHWISAKGLLDEALDIWKKRSYVKGAFDASLKLSYVLKELGTNCRDEALKYARLAVRLGTHLHLPSLGDAQRQFNSLAQLSSRSQQFSVRQADDALQESSFSKILRTWHFIMYPENWTGH
jgi:tetratricopeptide (TPR) repeat protein